VSTRALVAFHRRADEQEEKGIDWLQPVQPFWVDDLLQVMFALWLQHFGTLVGRARLCARFCGIAYSPLRGHQFCARWRLLVDSGLGAPFLLATWV